MTALALAALAYLGAIAFIIRLLAVAARNDTPPWLIDEIVGDQPALPDGMINRNHSRND